MPDCVHPAVNRVQPPVLKTPIDLATADTPGEQLPAGHHAVLIGRKFGNHPVGRLKPNLATHMVVNFGLNAHRPRMSGKVRAGTRRGSQSCGGRAQRRAASLKRR